MAPTPTKRLRAEKQEQYTNQDSWGPELNIGTIEIIDAGFGTSEVTVNANVTLSVNNFAADQSRGLVLILSGAGGFEVTAPAVDKPYLVVNNCAANVTIKPTGGTAATVRAGVASWYYTNAAGELGSVVDPTLDKIKAPAAAVAMNGQKLTGLGTGVNPGDAINFGQFDAIINSGNVAIVAGIAPQIATVAGISTQVVTVAANATAVATVAANISAVVTVANINSAVSTVATNQTHVNTVGANIAAVNTAATNILDIQNAAANAQLAKDYATKAVDSPVQPGLFSAYHWSVKAAASAASINPANLVSVLSQTFSSGQKLQAQQNIGAISLGDVRRNMWVNGSFRDSQENGNALGTTSGFYPADQTALFFGTTGGGRSIQRVQTSRSLAGSANKIEYKCTTAKGGLASNDVEFITQNIEGSNPDFIAAGFGTAGAKPLILRFEISAPQGTYHCHFANSGSIRHCAVPFTITAGEANTPVTREVVIPPDTGGTWLTGDGQIGITCDVVLAAGPTYTGGTASTWGTSIFFAASTQKNILDSTSNVARFADVGLKVDPDATGVYGPYRVVEVDPVFRSERYFEGLPSGNQINTPNPTATTGNKYVYWVFKARKAKVPAMSGMGVAYAGTQITNDMAGAYSPAVNEPVIAGSAVANSRLA